MSLVDSRPSEFGLRCEAPPSPLVGEGGRAKLGRMRGVPAWRTPLPKSPMPRFFQHPSSVSALRADPPSPTRGEGIAV
ncbi:MAG: hypothetical protein E5Y18_01495 [Mesorhizobium sp.]|nr:MAG: hypothetical protein E5Y18_01495 [Mesorhizobium sp.]